MTTVVRVALIALAVTLVSTTAYAITLRITYPFELEWLEGATVVHVVRLLRGEPLYVEPSLTFVPFAYPPLYYYASAAIASIAGPGFVAVRLVSVAASVITAAAIFVIVCRVTGVLAAVCACAVFAGAYAASGGWYDLGRVDALYVALLALCYLACSRANTAVGWAVAGAIAFLASIVKQPALVALAPLAMYLLVMDRRAALWFCGTLGVLTVAFLLVMTVCTDGWYAYYVLQLPGDRMRVSFRPERVLGFWMTDMPPFAIALAAGALVLIRKREWRQVTLVSGFVLSAWISRVEGGAWTNTLMPAHLAAAILLGLSLRSDFAAPLARCALAALQLAVLLYDPRPYIPTSENRAAGSAFVASLQSTEGSVWVVDHSYWATLAGRPEHAHGWAMTDVLWADGGATGRKLEAEIRHAIEARRFSRIILDDDRFWFFKDVVANYEVAGEIQGPVVPSGANKRPRYVYVKR